MTVICKLSWLGIYSDVDKEFRMEKDSATKKKQEYQNGEMNEYEDDFIFYLIYLDEEDRNGSE